VQGTAPDPGPGRPAKYEKEPEINVPTPPIPPEIPEEPMENQVRSERGQFPAGTAPGPERPPLELQYI